MSDSIILFTDQTNIDFAVSPTNNVYTVKPDGSDLTAIIPATEDFWFSAVFNADCSKLLATTMDSTTFVALGLWLMNPDGSDKVQITNMDSTSPDFLAEWTPQFSPDGTKCVLPYGHDTGYGGDGISIVNLDNSGFNNIPTGPQHPVDDPQPFHPVPNGPTAIYWSPDGSKFAWNAGPFDDGAGSAAWCNTLGNVTIVLLGSYSSSPFTNYTGVYGWFSDSETLLIESTPSGGGTDLLKSNGVSTFTLFSDPTDTFFGNYPTAISPDDTRLAYYDPDTGGLGVWDIASSSGSIIVPQLTLGENTTVNTGFVQWITPTPLPIVIPKINVGASASGIVPLDDYS